MYKMFDEVMEILFCDVRAVLQLQFVQITNILIAEETEIKVCAICF